MPAVNERDYVRKADIREAAQASQSYADSAARAEDRGEETHHVVRLASCARAYGAATQALWCAWDAERRAGEST